MKTRLGSNLYRAGLIGASISIIYTINVIWISESGSSFLPLPERYVSPEEMVSTAAAGILVTLLFWGGGAAANYKINKRAETRAAAEKQLMAGSSRR